MPDPKLDERTVAEKTAPFLAFMNLFDVQVDIEPVENLKDSSLTYDIFITPPERNGNDQFAFRCEVAVGRKKAGQEHNFIEISATYGCIVEGSGADDAENVRIAKQYAATSTWSSFASLFSLISHQMKVEFPPLPPFPGEVDVRSLEEDEDDDELTEPSK